MPLLRRLALVLALALILPALAHAQNSDPELNMPPVDMTQDVLAPNNFGPVDVELPELYLDQDPEFVWPADEGHWFEMGEDDVDATVTTEADADGVTVQSTATQSGTGGNVTIMVEQTGPGAFDISFACASSQATCGNILTFTAVLIIQVTDPQGNYLGSYSLPIAMILAPPRAHVIWYSNEFGGAPTGTTITATLTGGGFGTNGGFYYIKPISDVLIIQ